MQLMRNYHYDEGGNVFDNEGNFIISSEEIREILKPSLWDYTHR